MRRASSDKDSRGSRKPKVVAESMANSKPAEIENEEQEDSDEEEQSLPALTSSTDRIDKGFSLESVPVKTPPTPESTAEAAMTKIQGSAHEGTGTYISTQIQKIIERELAPPGKRGIDLQSVPMKEYLEQTVIPIVHQGLMALAKERPAAPIEYLAAYFLKHKHQYQADTDQQQGATSDQQIKSSDAINFSNVENSRQNSSQIASPLQVSTEAPSQALASENQ